MAKVDLENVWIEYPLRINGKIQKETKVAIEDLSLSLKDGDRLGISGPNGSGKSSLLRVIAGVQPPSRGTKTTEGRVGSMLSISSGFSPKATGAENITYRATLLGMSKQQAEEAIQDAAETFGLAKAMSHPIETYSSGMKMRLGFSLATSAKPEILIMDEWLTVGDSEFGKIARDRLEEVVEKSNIIVLASHSENLLDKFSSRRLELERS